VDVYSHVLDLVESLALSRVPVEHKPSVRDVLKSSFAFIATFVHFNPGNQTLVWSRREALLASIGDGVGAEIALAEVPSSCATLAG
jgi:hypothetical protein